MHAITVENVFLIFSKYYKDYLIKKTSATGFSLTCKEYNTIELS